MTVNLARYRTICADPPWPGDWFAHGPGPRKKRAVPPEYGLMSMRDIEALPVSELAEDDAALFLWVPARLNREGVGVRVARGWGFEPVSEIVWAKPNFGQGLFPRLGHEILLICRRGKHVFSGPLNVHSVQRWSQRYGKNGKRHSAKPEGATDLIEQHSPGPYLELFARQQRMGWSVWGNEVTGSVEMRTAS